MSEISYKILCHKGLQHTIFPVKKTILLSRSVYVDTAPNSTKHLSLMFNALFQQNSNAHEVLCWTRRDLGICLSTSLNWDHATIYRKLFVPVLLFNTYSHPMAFPSVYLPFTTAKHLGLQFSSSSHMFKIRMDIISSTNLIFLLPYLHRNTQKKKKIGWIIGKLWSPKSYIISGWKSPSPPHWGKQSHRN